MKLSLAMLAAASCMLIVGCAAQTVPPGIASSVISINHFGAACDPSKPDVPVIKKKQFDDAMDATFADMDHYFDTKYPGKTRKILIFVHGGLNDPDQSLAAAENEIPQIKCAGYYPIMINWNSGLGSAYSEHLFSVTQGESSSHSWRRAAASPFYLFADVGEAISRFPKVILNEWGTDLDSAACDYTVIQDKPAGLTMTIGSKYTGNRAGSYIAYAITFIPKVVFTPVIDCIGTPSWQNMSRRTLMAFDGSLGNQPLFGGTDDGSDPHNDYRKEGAVSMFRDALFKHIGDARDANTAEVEQSLNMAGQRQFTFMAKSGASASTQKAANTPDYEITLIGHSMGTMLLNEWLRRDIVEGHKTVYKNIVYMAAACSVRDYGRAVIPYLKKYNPKNCAHPPKFYSLMLHPLAELRETYAYDIAPRGSLLVWLDDFMTDPQTPLDRTLGRWDNIAPAIKMIPDDTYAQTTFRSFALAPSSDWPPKGQFDYGPQRHGQFRDMKYWDPRFWDPADDVLVGLRTAPLKEGEPCP